jgi:NAD(P)-dependent dehydrogenase (short-subunit alcohol dehydrogenase family)
MGNGVGRVAAITGAAGNVGRAVTSHFEMKGVRLALLDRSADRLRAERSAGSPSVLIVDVPDVTDPATVSAAIDSAVAHFGRIDTLVNTVGGFKADLPVHEEPLETWDAMFDVNLRSALLTCRAAVPHMLRQRHGRIVNIAALAGVAAFARAGAYSASKAALIRMTEALAHELKGSGVTANCVLPGTIDTPQNRAAMPSADPRKWLATTDLAEVIAFLADDCSRAVTGAAIPVTGSG